MIRGGRMEFHTMNLEEIQKCSNKELEEILLHTDNARRQDFGLNVYTGCVCWK